MIHLYETNNGERRLVAKASLEEMLACGVTKFFKVQNMVGRHDYEYVPEEERDGREN
jgi:hypothetical protein